MEPDLTPEEDWARSLQVWQAHCMGGPLLWKTSVAALAVLIFYYVVATWGCHR